MSQTPRLLVSACLCGKACRYNGSAAPDHLCMALAEKGLALPVCPECMGGLDTPRPPLEIRGGKVFDKNGEDRTDACAKGALAALRLAEEHGIQTAILKERSPSCGSSLIYDGTFSGCLIPGEGLTTALLRQNGITVYSEKTAPGDLCA